MAEKSFSPSPQEKIPPLRTVPGRDPVSNLVIVQLELAVAAMLATEFQKTVPPG